LQEASSAKVEDISRASLDMSSSLIKPSDLEALVSGWMLKSEDQETWKKRWFILANDCSLYSFRSNQVIDSPIPSLKLFSTNQFT